jgi:hypothetical protein
MWFRSKTHKIDKAGLVHSRLHVLPDSDNCDALHRYNSTYTQDFRRVTSLERRLDMSPHLRPSYNRHVRPENRPTCKHWSTWFGSTRTTVSVVMIDSRDAIWTIEPMNGQCGTRAFQAWIIIVDRTHVPNLHIIMRRRLLGQVMAVTSSIPICGSVWGFPSITEISVRKTHFRSSCYSVWAYDNTNKRNLLFLNISL